MAGTAALARAAVLILVLLCMGCVSQERYDRMVNSCDKVNLSLKKERDKNADLREQLAAFEEKWFQKLSIDQQIRWRMHRDILLKAGTVQVQELVNQN